LSCLWWRYSAKALHRPNSSSISTSRAQDPDYAPAVLTVGTYEYIHGRTDAAMELLLPLIDLPEETEDLFVIIDEAGGCLIEREEFDLGLALYSSAAAKYPDEHVFQAGIRSCAGGIGKPPSRVTR
jgi:hypothetical protein